MSPLQYYFTEYGYCVAGASALFCTGKLYPETSFPIWDISLVFVSRSKRSIWSHILLQHQSMTGHPEYQFCVYWSKFNIQITYFLSVIKITTPDRAITCIRLFMCNSIQPQHIRKQSLVSSEHRYQAIQWCCEELVWMRK